MREVSLYQNTVTVQFEEGRHKYLINGKSALSVTACTGIVDKSRPLIFWATGLAKEYLVTNLETLRTTTDEHIILQLINDASKQHQIKKEQAATTGSQVHAWVGLFITGEKPELPEDPKVYNGVTAFLKWVDEHKVQFSESEKIIYSKKYDYVGIFDAEAMINGELCIVEFKTSAGLYNEMRYQVAAYRAAAEEERGKKYKGNAWLVRFGKETGEFEAVEMTEHAKDFKAFLGCLALKRREKELSKW